MNLTSAEKNDILEIIKSGGKLPKEYIYKLYEQDEDVFLFWNGRKEEVTNVVLPFHSIEHIDEPRAEKAEEGAPADMLFDTRGRQLKGWTNKLIWGDNKLILSSLVNGPMREEIDRNGGVKLIYIDPPFAVGADFNYDISINGETAEKKQTVIEEIAYRDTWGRGISSYLTMMYERLKLMHQLLANDGSIYVHCDWRVNSVIRLALDDVFGVDNFINEVVWYYGGPAQITNKFPRKYDSIFLYSKSKNHIFNKVYGELPKYLYDRARKDPDGRLWVDQNLGNLRPETIEKMKKEGRVFETNRGNLRRKQYLDEMGGAQVDDVWNIIVINSQSEERLDYPTQKPEKLLERIIKASSNEGDIVADFFCGSGTTAAVAEKLGRKWIAADLGRFAIHTTRKRMIGVQRQLQKEGKDYRAFEVLNLGKYERQFFVANLAEKVAKYNVGSRPASTAGDAGVAPTEIIRHQMQDSFIDLILSAYGAKPVANFKFLHGKRAGRMVHVGPLDVPVTKSLIDDIFEECRANTITAVDVLGFEFEFGLTGEKSYIREELKGRGVDIRLRYIPKEVFDERAVLKGQVKFYDVAYLSARAKVKKGSVTVKLENFVTRYTQDDIEEIQNKLRAGSSKVIIENGQIIKITKSKKGIFKREVLTKSWTDWIDYWAVDFNYMDKKEIIRIGTNGDSKELWTGNYLFENEWQSFRTKRDPELELTSSPHRYDAPGKYKIMIKVVDILGVDTSQIIEVEVG